MSRSNQLKNAANASFSNLIPFYQTYDVSITLKRLECVSEYDNSGHSEPYIWPAFLKGDASTLLNLGNQIEFEVPFENHSGQGLLGQPSYEVRPGDQIPIPGNLGSYRTRLDFLMYNGQALMFTGFVLALLEWDSTPGGAMRAGHQAFAQSLRDEVNSFVLANMAFPNEQQVDAIKDTVNANVRSAIEGELSWYHWFYDHDDFLGFVGGADTLFTTDRIFSLSNQGPQEFRTPIRKTERIWRTIPWPARWMEVEHFYELFWEVEVTPVSPPLQAYEIAIMGQVEDALKDLERLDDQIAGLNAKLEKAEGDARAELLEKLRSLAKESRPEKLEALGLAWEKFVCVRK